jgi:hypothetical protein
LFDEFFMQGDLEKQENLPISFLCDRKTTNVAESQPGFLSYIVLPLFKTLQEIMPPLHVMVERAEENKKKWGAYTETTEDKQVYNGQKDGPIGTLVEQKSESDSDSDGSQKSE